MDALTKATLLLTEAPFARSFLIDDAVREQRSTGSRSTSSRAVSPTLEGARTTAAVVLFVTGVLLLAEAIVTVAWQEPFSALSAQRQQDKLSAELRVAESAALAAPAQFATKRNRCRQHPRGVRSQGTAPHRQRRSARAAADTEPRA